jgi:hypothetical protein
VMTSFLGSRKEIRGRSRVSGKTGVSMRPTCVCCCSRPDYSRCCRRLRHAAVGDFAGGNALRDAGECGGRVLAHRANGFLVVPVIAASEGPVLRAAWLAPKCAAQLPLIALLVVSGCLVWFPAFFPR